MKKVISVILMAIFALTVLFLPSCFPHALGKDCCALREVKTMHIWQFNENFDASARMDLAFNASHFAPTNSYWVNELISLEDVYNRLKDNPKNSDFSFELTPEHIIITTDHQGLKTAFIRIWQEETEHEKRTEIMRGVKGANGEIVWVGQRAQEEREEKTLPRLVDYIKIGIFDTEERAVAYDGYVKLALNCYLYPASNMFFSNDGYFLEKLVSLEEVYNLLKNNPENEHITFTLLNDEVTRKISIKTDSSDFQEVFLKIKQVEGNTWIISGSFANDVIVWHNDMWQ